MKALEGQSGKEVSWDASPVVSLAPRRMAHWSASQCSSELSTGATRQPDCCPAMRAPNQPRRESACLQTREQCPAPTFMTLSYLRLPSSFSSTGGSLGPTWLGRGAAGEEERFECSRQDEGQQNGPFLICSSGRTGGHATAARPLEASPTRHPPAEPPTLSYPPA